MDKGKDIIPQTNRIDIRFIDAVEAGEEWANNYEGKPPLIVAAIHIDDMELLGIFKSIERNKGYDSSLSYGHITPESLYRNLSEAIIEGTYSNKYGVYLCCCGDCGEPGCWSVACRVNMDENYVYWHSFEHEHRKNWRYSLKYKFCKEEYNSVMKKLQNAAFT